MPKFLVEARYLSDADTAEEACVEFALWLGTSEEVMTRILTLETGIVASATLDVASIIEAAMSEMEDDLDQFDMEACYDDEGHPCSEAEDEVCEYSAPAEPLRRYLN